jgi:sodium transport system permease protein
MNWKHIITIYLKELKDSLRDRRTLISMVVIPTFLMPLIIFGVGTIMTKVVKKAQDEQTSMVVIGGEDSPSTLAALKAEKKFKIVEVRGSYQKMISEKQIRLAVEIPPGFEASLKESSEPKTVMLYHYEGELKSGMGVGEVDRFFRNLREKAIERRLADRGLPADLIKPFEIKRQNVAPPEKVGGNMIGGLIPYIIIILCFTGAMYPAIDLTAGEKERGTMETLLCSPVHRVNIVLGKFLMVMTASIATIVLTLVSSSVSIIVGGSMMMGNGGGAKAAGAAAGGGGFMPIIDPAGILGVFAMIAPVAMLFAALLLTIALFAKSYKEAQSYVSPLIIVVIMPAMMGMLPGIELSAKTALVPILNLSLVCKEMLSGVWHWHYIALIFGSTVVYAAAAVALCVRMFNREDVIFRA